MQPWVIGLVLVLVAGVGIILYGALSDRTAHRRRVAELTSVPDRRIPQFSPEPAAAPRYLSELQARREPEGAAPGLSTEERRRLRDQLDRAVTVPLGYASRDFVTDRETGWAVLDQPAVLVCAEPVTSLRELVGLLEKTLLGDRSLVIVTPAVDADVLATLEVNRIQRLLRVVVVLGRDPRPVDEVCAATGARLVSRIDLQAGYVTDAELGRCERWVSTDRRSHVIGPVD